MLKLPKTARMDKTAAKRTGTAETDQDHLEAGKPAITLEVEDEDEDMDVE